MRVVLSRQEVSLHPGFIAAGANSGCRVQSPCFSGSRYKNLGQKMLLQPAPERLRIEF